MLKTFKSKTGMTIIEISEEGKVTYVVGQKKTTFDLSECDAFTYEYEAMDERLVITKDMIARHVAKADREEAVDQTKELEPWLWLVISKGEERLEYNNNQTESRRHYSYSDQDDKIDTLMVSEDLFERVFEKLEKEELIEAIQALEPQQQELVKDLFYEGMSMSEIARRDGISKMSISKRMNTIKKHLKEKIKNFSK